MQGTDWDWVLADWSQRKASPRAEAACAVPARVWFTEQVDLAEKTENPVLGSRSTTYRSTENIHTSAMNGLGVYEPPTVGGWSFSRCVRLSQPTILQIPTETMRKSDIRVHLESCSSCTAETAMWYSSREYPRPAQAF